MKKIKKSVAFVATLLLMTSGLNAYNVYSPSCFEWADSVATQMGFMQGWNYQQEHTAFLALFDECVALQQQ